MLYLCQSWAETLLSKRLRHKTIFLQNISWHLLSLFPVILNEQCFFFNSASSDYFIQVTKMKRNKSQLFKETTWVITTVCHWSNCKCNNMQTCFPCFFSVDHIYSTLHGYLSVREDWQTGSFLGGILWGHKLVY